MKSNVLILLFLLVLSISCASAPATTPTTAPTFVAIKTAAATQTALPVPSVTETATVTNTPLPTVTQTATPKPTPTPTRLLPELYVDGPYIKRRDTGEAVLFKGVNIHTFHNGNQQFGNAKEYMDIAKSWGANLIRFQIDIRLFNIVDLEKAIGYAEQNGMYVILTPAAAGNRNYIISPTDETKDFVLDLAARFAARKNELYGLVNEVGDEKGDGWYDILVNQERDFRLKFPNPLLVMSGWYWNRDFSLIQRRPFPDKNTIVDVHYYSLNPGSPGRLNFEFMLGKYPVLFGGGAGIPYRENPETDIQWITRVLKYVSDNPLMAHYTAFEMAPGTWRTSIFNPDGRTLHPTHGKPYFDDMQVFPPTDFLK